MSWLIESSLRMRVIVIALAIALIVVGVRTADNIPLDVFPEFAPPVVEIQTEAPGVSTEEVESLITVPIENSLNGIPFLKTVRSKSVLGLSSVRLIFAEGSDLLIARQLVQERLSTIVANLPASALAPRILPPLSSLSRCLKIGLWQERPDVSDIDAQREMTVLARWTLRPRLMATPGVANVAIWGEKDPQLQVVVDPDRLQANNLTLDTVLLTVRDAVMIGAGGFVDTANQRLAIRHLPPVYSPEELGEVVIAFRGGAPLRIRDVAEVMIDHAPPIGDAIINSRPGLLLIVEKQPWANTLDVTRGVEAAMKSMEPALGATHYDTTIFRPATFIERSIANLGQSMLIGCVLVVVVLILFLFDWRSALISATAIPLSLVATAMVLYWRGGTINTMVLAGLVIALGEVVDDAIIDVENIVRRLRINSQSEHPRSAFAVVLSASLEVRSAVVYATLIVIFAFLPVFFLEGLAGSFFRPLAMAYILAILASLLVALTVTPALSLMLLPQAASRRHRDGPLVAILKRMYRGVLPMLLRRPRITLASSLALVGSLGLLLPLLGEELMPRFKETDFLMHWVEKPGIGIDAMNRITIRASEELMEVDGVRNFGSHIGRAEVADEVVGPNFTELWISIDESADYDATVAEVQEIVDGYPGLYRDLLTYLTERIKEVLSGTSASIVVRTYGPNLEQLRATAQEIAGAMKNVKGVTTLKVEPQVLTPQIAVKMRPEAASRFGLTSGALMRAVTTLVNGSRVGEIYEDQKIYGVVVRGENRLHPDVASLSDLMIDTPSGAQVPLRDVADIAVVPAPNVIQREGASRRIDVTCNVAGRDLGSVARDIEKAVLADVHFGEGYHPEFLGEYAEAQASRQRMMLLSVIAVIAILLILYVDFQSWRLVLIMALMLPLSLLGGVVGALAVGGVISLGSLVGFVTVLGIAARNAIMLVSHYRHLEQEEGLPFDLELILRGAEERLAPILMTALTTGLALAPLVLTGNVPGQEIEYPMACVILGGIVTSTFLNLFVLPIEFYLFGQLPPGSRAEKE
ncbi:efflux RND transporter permease subunit [Lignipirellula cremea]|uniref:Cobalt-zinc-cadmium resistance protein CzcA n=1 Tax=Lignipirellula cremea TaxID=2528010 RepID=A0A518E3N6_9BACT|nr:efflux RND transporter permease subunit [Lignipirellula cremea]QDU98698.1 Cobalt-zinc-cadmium resistance protein CzcA [Lignipirellula cremea]